MEQITADQAVELLATLRRQGTPWMEAKVQVQQRYEIIGGKGKVIGVDFLHVETLRKYPELRKRTVRRKRSDAKEVVAVAQTAESKAEQKLRAIRALLRSDLADKAAICELIAESK